MKEYKGKKVPVKPERSWKWMKSLGTGCRPISAGHCRGIACYECIYSGFNAALRKRFYEETFGKPKGTQAYFKGLELPVEPQKSWKWMFSEKVCGRKKECELESHHCSDCIYSMQNWERRKECYEYFFPKETPKKTAMARDRIGRFIKKTLPKFTQEVFEDPKCPAWAKWAAVDKDGSGWWFEKEPTVGLCCWTSIEPQDRLAQIEGKFDTPAWPYHSLIERPAKRLTVEVFSRPDCPDWAQYAVLDSRGAAYYTQNKPVAANDVALDWLVGGSYRKISEEHFDASNWQNSLIARPSKELPKLTQTAFHCPDCPKEATKLKVFPSNHVVALDEDDKVLSVMELQCKEGEVKKIEAEWYYNKETDILYYGKDFEYTSPPAGADPVKVSYLLPDVLKGTAVHKIGVAEDCLIVDVNGSLVTLVGVKGKDYISMVTLILNYRITCSGDRCCVIEPLQ